MIVTATTGNNNNVLYCYLQSTKQRNNKTRAINTGTSLSHHPPSRRNSRQSRTATTTTTGCCRARGSLSPLSPRPHLLYSLSLSLKNIFAYILISSINRSMFLHIFLKINICTFFVIVRLINFIPAHVS
jgi:hypothetical protein